MASGSYRILVLVLLAVLVALVAIYVQPTSGPVVFSGLITFLGVCVTALQKQKN